MMKRFRSDSLLAIGLILLMAVVLFAAAMSQSERPQQPVLASFSNTPTGGRALRLWLDALNYEVSDKSGATYAIPDGTTLALLLEPDPITPDEWTVLDKWVEAGNVLLLVGSQAGANLAASHFDFDQQYTGPVADQLVLQVPVKGSPPLQTPVAAHAGSYYTTTRTDYIAHLGMEQGPVAVSFPQGKGRVILCTAPFPFTNQGLKEPGNAQFVLHLLVGARRKTVWIDEWHHGQRGAETSEIVGFEQWLPHTSAGQAILYSLAVIFIALLLSGRAFGRPLPPPGQVARRTPLEYITALARLSQRAGHRQAAIGQYYTHLKRQLGRRYRLDPTLPDTEYVAGLSRLRPDLDAASLLNLLQRLQRASSSARIREREMVQLANDAASWIKQETSPGAGPQNLPPEKKGGTSNAA